MPKQPLSPSICLSVALAVAASGRTARAQEVDVSALPDIADRDYSIDLYQGSVLGSGRIVGMGGAAVASAEGSAGTSANPASPAVRPTTSNDKWDWDWHIDWLSPELGSDFDNNGIPTTEELTVTPLITAGLVGQYKSWALGLSVNNFSRDVGEDETAAFTLGTVVLARSFHNDEFTVGIGSRFGNFEMLQKTGNSNTTRFLITGSALETGGLWRPPKRNFRVGASLSLPISGSEVQVAECELVSCDTLPSSVEVPWRVAAGVAYRRAATRWNQKVKSEWRDERALTLAMDVVIVGAVKNGHGIEAYVEDKLQRSGRDVVLSYRGGAEYEWKPGWLRVRAGTYWEPGRFQSHAYETIGGRMHGTFGIEVRVYSFCFWGERYRARLSLTGDAADHYFNGGLSVGLWH